ncbi:hypothetical protein R1flu_000034 [Riccia fluitans]|uniref:Uncharacterized protein n=1 Tax=Riccia fluitans TaxID=41844 RepID=A0ABD1XZA0_9MARC
MWCRCLSRCVVDSLGLQRMRWCRCLRWDADALLDGRSLINSVDFECLEEMLVATSLRFLACVASSSRCSFGSIPCASDFMLSSVCFRAHGVCRRSVWIGSFRFIFEVDSLCFGFQVIVGVFRCSRCLPEVFVRIGSFRFISEVIIGVFDLFVGVFRFAFSRFFSLRFASVSSSVCFAARGI